MKDGVGDAHLNFQLLFSDQNENISISKLQIKFLHGP